MREMIAVVGAGAAGAVTAAYLTQKGYDVILCDEKEQCLEDFEKIRKDGISVTGALSCSSIFPAALACEISEAMKADRILVCVSSGRQEAVAEWMAPYIESRHKLLLMPGNLGTVVFHRVLQARQKQAGLLAELAECLWACRRLEPGCYISAMPLGKKRIGAFPVQDTGKAAEAFEDLFPLQASPNLIENCLNSPNVITHLAGTLLNLGDIEKKGKEYALFEDGLSDGYIRCLELLETERKQVLESMKMECYAPPVRPLLEQLKSPETPEHLIAFKGLKGPDKLEHRYITEDGSCGVALLVSLAEKQEIAVPVTKALLTLAGALTGHDYGTSGRTWEWLGEEKENVC